MHDSDIKRTTTGEGAIEKMTLADLKKVKMINSDETVPTADELLSLFDNRKDFYIELELKPRYGELYSPERMDDFLNKLYAIAEKHLSNGFYLFTCFDHDVLRRTKELHPDIHTGLICGGLRQLDVDAAINLGCLGLSPIFEGTDQALVEKAIAAGLAINLWHSETLDLWKEAKARGAFISTNNNPVKVLQAIKDNGLF
jgi:glycerophosphoryl diester phosphodiesterase